MMDFKSQNLEASYQVNHVVPKDWKIVVYKRAVRAYQNICLRGALWRFWCRLTRKSFTLMDFSVILKGCQLDNQYELGIQTIPLKQVMGSVGRSKDFDARFFPLKEKESQKRWIGIAEQFLTNQSIPAVEVMQVGERYFVKDGHHRVSAARALGIQYIEAQVCVLSVHGDLPWVTNPFRVLRPRQVEQIS